MTKSKWRQKFKKWLGDWQLAFSGIALATKKPKFCLVAIISFLVFGTLLNLLAGGTASFALMGAVDFWGKLEIIRDAFLGVFGVGRAFTDWLLYFFIALLQGMLIGLVALVWKKRKDKALAAKAAASESTQNSDNLQRASLSVGLAVLGSGCPTCGTTLLAPLIGVISSSGGLALAGAISGILTAISIIIALFALKKVGKEAYIELVNESYQRKESK